MTTPRLSITEIAVGQAAKEIAHNEALRVIDALMSGKAKTRLTTTPPGSPAEGDVHVVPSGATGAWSGQTNKLAHFYGNAWFFYTCKTGMTLWSDADNEFIVFDGTVWDVKVAPSFTVGTLPPQKAGRIIYVSNEVGGAVLAFSDGTNYRRVTDRAIVA